MNRIMANIFRQKYVNYDFCNALLHDVALDFNIIIHRRMRQIAINVRLKISINYDNTN